MKKLANLISIAEGVDPDDCSFATGKVKIRTATQHSHYLATSRKVEEAVFPTF